MNPRRDAVDKHGRRTDGTGPADVADLLLEGHEEAVLAALARVLSRRRRRRDEDDTALGRTR